MTLFWISIAILLALAMLLITLPLRQQLHTRRDVLILGCVAIFIVIFSLTLYLHQGSSNALKQSLALQERAAHLQALLAEINNDPQKAIAMMKAYLKKHPHDKHAQYLLHKLYQSVK